MVRLTERPPRETLAEGRERDTYADRRKPLGEMENASSHLSPPSPPATQCGSFSSFLPGLWSIDTGMGFPPL